MNLPAKLKHSFITSFAIELSTGHWEITVQRDLNQTLKSNLNQLEDLSSPLHHVTWGEFTNCWVWHEGQSCLNVPLIDIECREGQTNTWQEIRNQNVTDTPMWMKPVQVSFFYKLLKFYQHLKEDKSINEH